MKSSQPLVNERSAAFTRLASRILETINSAVEYRREQGHTLTSIADKMGCHRSSLTRILNGSSPNLTVRTISDVLWATSFDPVDFVADPIENICPNWNESDSEYPERDNIVLVYDTQTVKMDAEKIWGDHVNSSFRPPQFEKSVR